MCTESQNTGLWSLSPDKEAKQQELPPAAVTAPWMLGEE